MWYPVESCADVAGATLSVLSERAWLIGGSAPLPVSTKGGKVVPPLGMQAQQTSTVLQIFTLELSSMTWKNSLINTNGHQNRLGHASVAIGPDRVLVFGGIIAGAGDGRLAEDILLVQDSLFGLMVTAAPRGVECRRQGLSACCAAAGGDAVFLFGGFDKDKVYSAELSLYLHTDLALEGVAVPLVDLEVVEGIKPPARAFHSCVLGGPGGSMLMLFGGQSSTGELLGDLWVCDVSEVVDVLRRAMALGGAAAGREETKGEGEGEGEEGGGGGAQPDEAEAEAPALKLPPVQWKCLREASSSAAPRLLHGSYSYLSTVEDSDPAEPCVQLCVFGGTRSDGRSSTEVLEVTIVGHEVRGDFAAREALPVPATVRLCGPAVATLGSDGVAAGAVVLFAGCSGLLRVLDDRSSLAVQARRAVAKSNRPTAESKEGDSKQQQKQQQQQSALGLPKRVRYKNGDVFEGALKRPSTESDEDPVNAETLVRHGAGTMRYARPEGESYTGEWVENDRQGQGSSVGADELYEGQFWADRRHGHGVLRDAQGGKIIYEGAFETGLFHGRGTMHGPDGTYEGDFHQGRRHGTGQLTGESGFRYTGTFRDDAVAGQGEVQDQPLGSGVYSGPTLDGTPSGPGGYCSYPDGSEYEGDWKSGTRNGMGRYVAPNHDTYEGKWVGGRRWRGRWQSSSGLEFYDGYWDQDKPHGFGCRGYPNGEVWEGQWDHGVRLDGSDFGNTADARQWGGGGK